MKTFEEQKKYIFENGKSYIPSIFPFELRDKLGDIGMCFDVSILAALGSKYRYVEGIAHIKGTGQYFLHAWITDGIHAFDPTWKSELIILGKKFTIPGTRGIEYFGIELDKIKVAYFMSETKYVSVIANGWRAPESAKQILPK